MFSFFGYLSVLLWLGALGLFGVHFRQGTRRWLSHYALGVVLLAFVLAQMNSRWHVNYLQIDHSEAIAEAAAREAAARKLAEDERAGDVAQIRFAEDDRTDFLDMAGLDETDRKYIESMTETSEPAWRQEKRQRSTTRAQDDSLEGRLDTSEKAGGLETRAVKTARKEIVLPAQAVSLAHRLDAFLLRLLRWCLLVGVGVVLVDYLQRVNRGTEAYLPLPLPSSLVNGLSPLPVVCEIPPSQRRTPAEELAWLVRRGDTFIFLTTDATAAAAIPEQMPRLPHGKCPFEVLHVQTDDPLTDDAFIFEALWYNRAAFVIDSAIRAESFLTGLHERLVERRQTRAHVRQTVHIVWDLHVALQNALQKDMIRLIGETGFCLRILPTSQKSVIPRQ